MILGRATRSIVTGTLLSTTLLFASACSESGELRRPTTSSDLGVDVSHDQWHDIGYGLSWIGYPYGKPNRNTKISDIKAYDDVIVVQNTDSTIAALESTSGKRRWGAELSSPLTRYLGFGKDPAGDGLLQVCSESELFVVSVTNGALLNRQRFERVISTPPLLLGETIVCGTNTNELYAHNSRLGMRAWGMITDGGYAAAPILVGDIIASVTQKGMIQFFSLKGKLLSDRRIFGGVECQPVTNGSRLIIASLDQSLWGFDPLSGSTWRYRASAPLRVQPTARGDLVWCDIPGEGLICFDAASGSVIWKSEKASGSVFAMRRGKLLIWNDGEILQLDAKNGDVITRFITPGIVRVIAPSFEDGPIYTVSDVGAVAKFDSR